VNPIMEKVLGAPMSYLQAHLFNYVKHLKQFMVWPYHCELGSIGWSLAPTLDEAAKYWSVCRGGQNVIHEIKGNHPLSENYGAVALEMNAGPAGEVLKPDNNQFVELLMGYNMVLIMGEAADYCVATTIRQIIDKFLSQDPALAKKIYIVEDTMSPVVAPGYDGMQCFQDALTKFRASGANVVKSTDPIEDWPGVKSSALALV
jgi:nicotinamidase-related amidase